MGPRRSSARVESPSHWPASYPSWPWALEARKSVVVCTYMCISLHTYCIYTKHICIYMYISLHIYMYKKNAGRRATMMLLLLKLSCRSQRRRYRGPLHSGNTAKYPHTHTYTYDYTYVTYRYTCVYTYMYTYMHTMS